MSRRLCLLLAVSAVITVRSHAAESWRIEPAGAEWTVEGKVKKSDDVSGAATLRAGAGVLVSDETRSVQPFRFDAAARKLIMEPPVVLLAGESGELDLEAVAASTRDGCYYVTGSHSVARKTGEVQPDRRHVFRVPFNAATGALAVGSIAVTTLVPVIESDAILREALGKRSEEGGLDIEGLAEKDGSLFFGVRSPSIEGQAFLIEVRAGELFEHPDTAAHRTHRIALGTGFGIRDIAGTRDGFLLIAGPSGSDEAAHGFSIHHWAGPGGALVKVGDLAASTGKAEGLLVLGETDAAVDVLILFDSAPNGAPTPLRLIKPSPALTTPSKP